MRLISRLSSELGVPILRGELFRSRVISLSLMLCMGYFFVATSGSAQKPAVDTSDFVRWPVVGYPALSNDGRYAAYRMDPWGPTNSTVLQTLRGDWKVVLAGVQEATFTDDSRKAVALKGKDSLVILTLGTTAVEYLPVVRAYRLFKQGDSEWLAYQAATPDKRLVLRNVVTGAEHSFSGVTEYVVSADGNAIVCRAESHDDSIAPQTVVWVRLPDGKPTTIWRGKNASQLVLDASGTQVAFSVEGNGGNAIWYHRAGGGPAVLLADDGSAGIDPGLRVDAPSAFGRDGSSLFVTLRENQGLPDSNALKVDVWSYTDAKLQSQQLSDGTSRSYQAVVRVCGAPRKLVQWPSLNQ